ncbi:PilZ domain-containing protein [Gilvimarinus agarilyticus]|uniref:PilZ domain-containing protein n=1 Tax=Gilvimarinus agarilyticus TaxID=679259 RepID=UPI0005A0C236|nr:PilZ domain-containing protein [Gilvimarinus agarilyticus]
MKKTFWRELLQPLKNLSRNTDKTYDAEQKLTACLPQNHHCLETLNQWLANRRVLSVGNQHWQGQSLLMAIDSRRDILWLDDIFPQQEQLGEGVTLQISLRQGFEHCYFSATVIAIVDKPAGRMIALHLPREIHRAPRRRQRRFNLPGPALNVRVRASGNEAETAQVINISAGGLRITLNGNRLTTYRPGTLLPFCRFTLGPDIVINCRATVKAAVLDKTSGRRTQVSLAFADIPVGQRHQVDAYLHKLEALQGQTHVPASA